MNFFLLIGLIIIILVIVCWDKYRKLSIDQKIAIGELLLLFIGCIFTYGTWQLSSTANDISKAANDISSATVHNSNLQLELERKKLAFDVINTLYQDFYKFDDHNSLVIRKLQNGEHIENEFYLGLYLNGFEDVYQQCKTGLLTMEDIRINFQHLIGPLCNNAQVENFILHRDNGLKLLCYKLYPQSNLAKKANTQYDSCK